MIDIGSYDKWKFSGDLLLVAITGSTLIGRKMYLISFMIGCIANICMAKFLGDDSPSKSVDICNESETIYGANIRRGSPSIVTALCFYSIGFLFMTRAKIDRLFVSSLFITGITIYINMANRCYTSMQLLLGAVVGAFLSYVCVVSTTAIVLSRANREVGIEYMEKLVIGANT